MSTQQFLETKTSVQRIGRSYLLAVFIIGLAIVAEVVLTETVLVKQSGSNKIVNVAGRQRMLSQRIAKDRLLTEVNPAVIQNLEVDIQEFEDAHAWLKVQLEGYEIYTRLTELDEAVRWFGRVDELNLSGTQQQAKFLEETDSFLAQMEIIVTEYSDSADATLAKFIFAKRAITLITLLLLGLEYMFLIRPLLKLVKQQIGHLHEAYLQISKNFTIISEQAKELQAADQNEKEAVAALASSEKRMRDILNSAADGLAVINLDSSAIEGSNTAFLNALEVSAITPSMGTLAELMHAKSVCSASSGEDFNSVWSRLVVGTRECIVVQFVGKQGQMRRFEVSSRRLESEPTMAVCVFRELTDAVLERRAQNLANAKALLVANQS